MIMTAASALAAAICAAVAVWNIVQRGKLEQQLKSTYDALSEKEREYVHMKEKYDSLCVEYDGLHGEYEKVTDELGEALREAEEARQRTEAVQNALTEVQNIWNYVGNADGQQEVS